VNQCHYLIGNGYTRGEQQCVLKWFLWLTCLSRWMYSCSLCEDCGIIYGKRLALLKAKVLASAERSRKRKLEKIQKKSRKKPSKGQAVRKIKSTPGNNTGLYTFKDSAFLVLSLLKRQAKCQEITDYALRFVVIENVESLSLSLSLSHSLSLSLSLSLSPLCFSISIFAKCLFTASFASCFVWGASSNKPLPSLRKRDLSPSLLMSQ